MRKHLTVLHGHAQSSTAQISQHTVMDVAKSMGFNELAIYAYQVSSDTDGELSARLDGILAGVSRGDLVVVQLPTWNDFLLEEEMVAKLRRLQCRIAIFIHDIPPIMFPSNYFLMSKYVELYNQADLLIVPSQAMADRLRLEGVTVEKILIQKMWDQLSTFQPGNIQFNKVIHFAGDIEKFDFVKNWSLTTPLEVYSRGDSGSLPENVHLNGWLANNTLLSRLSEGGFGLVWTDSEYIDDYFKLCITHKLSTYLLAGIPVFIPASLSNKDIIIDNGLGYVINNLEEAEQIINQLSNQDYLNLVKNVADFRPLISQGYFSQRLLTETMFQTLTNKLPQLSAKPSKLRKNLGRKEIAIFISTHQMESIENLLESLSDFNFHIMAPTLMAAGVHELSRYSNVSLYEAGSRETAIQLLDKCDFYLDIGYGPEVYSGLAMANARNLNCLAFTETVKNLKLCPSANVFDKTQVSMLVERIRDLIE
ncbi:sugar transferase [Hutsoniella sourekii]|uniref:sugar transferase n=1 Tax=Hutsoniella sourekii TaxID=87650 RepID=UPI0004BA80EC|nr:sugar transferase [Hutsoniella sourekii]